MIEKKKIQLLLVILIFFAWQLLQKEVEILYQQGLQDILIYYVFLMPEISLYQEYSIVYLKAI